VLKAANVAISMDGKGRWMDNVFIERLWGSVKYEEVYLGAYDSVAEARLGLERYFRFYNTMNLTMSAVTARASARPAPAAIAGYPGR
jgi:transposase InsO family protein